MSTATRRSTHFGQVLVMFAVWVADQELQSVKRRTRYGIERARPGNSYPDRWRRSGGCGKEAPASGGSLAIMNSCGSSSSQSTEK